jgi:hypothetical protein
MAEVARIQQTLHALIFTVDDPPSKHLSHCGWLTGIVYHCTVLGYGAITVLKLYA